MAWLMSVSMSKLLCLIPEPIFTARKMGSALFLPLSGQMAIRVSWGGTGIFTAQEKFSLPRF